MATQYLFELLCTPRQHSAPDSERDQHKKKTKKTNTHFRTYSRRALYDLPKLCMVIELVDFSIQRIVFSCRVHGKIRPNWPTRGFLSNSVTCEANHVKFESLMQDSWAYKSPWKFSKSVNVVVRAGRLFTKKFKLLIFWYIAQKGANEGFLNHLQCIVVITNSRPTWAVGAISTEAKMLFKAFSLE